MIILKFLGAKLEPKRTVISKNEPNRSKNERARAKNAPRCLASSYLNSPFSHILGLFCTFLGHFLVLWGYFWSWGQVQKHFWVPLMQSINFGFGSTTLSFCFYFGQIWGLFALFGPLGAIFGVEVRFKNIFGTYLHRLTTFILEV